MSVFLIQTNGRRISKAAAPEYIRGTHGPTFVDYPRERVVEYLRAQDRAALTPVLVNEYTDLAERFAVQYWSCAKCGATFEFGEVELSSPTSQPVCPECVDRDKLATLELSHPATN